MNWDPTQRLGASAWSGSVPACAHRTPLPTRVGAYQALEMTMEAGCLWMTRSAPLSRKADLIMIDMTGLHWHPNADPVSSLVYAANGNDVDTVVVDGHALMRNRTLLTVDERGLQRQVVDCGQAWRQRANFQTVPPWPVG